MMRDKKELEKALRYFRHKVEYTVESDERKEMYAIAAEAVEKVLNPDFVEVVRCRDCAFALDYDPTNDNVPLTENLWCDYWVDGTKKDGYCFRGERREEG